MLEFLALNPESQSGLNLDAVWWDQSTGEVWNGSAWVAFSAAALVAGATAGTEQGTTAVYLFPVPSGVLLKPYFVEVYSRAGGSFAVGDLAKASLGTGTTSVTFNSIQISGSGVTLTFHDSNADPVANVPFTILASGVPVASGVAGSNGVATFGLIDGTYSVVAVITNGTLFSTTALIVSGATTLTITGTNQAPISPPGTGKVLAQGYVHNGTAVSAGATIYYKLTGPPDGDGAIHDGDVKSTVADDFGFVSVELWQNSVYEFFFGRGEHKRLTTTTTTPVAIPLLISASSANR